MARSLSTAKAARNPARNRSTHAVAPQTCSVCASADVAIDEVFERGLWLLSECRRCANQWTEGPLGGSRGALARPQPIAEDHAEAA